MTRKNQGPEAHSKIPEQLKTWSDQVDQPENVNRIINALYAVCALLVVVDPFVHKHGPFEIEHIWGFYVLCGTITSVGLVIVAKVLRVILMKPEDYYDQ